MKGIISKKLCKLIYFCLIGKKGHFYYIKYELFISKQFLNNMQFFLEKTPFLKFIGLRKGLTLI